MMTEKREGKAAHCCPYCDEEIRAAALPWCQACGLTVIYCPECRKPVPKDNKSCSHCGAEVQG